MTENERKKLHVNPTSGHLGQTRTLYRIKEWFMWHGLVQDVANLVGVICEWSYRY